jgi:soluble lytic murein transglycosylase-like protein
MNVLRSALIALAVFALQSIAFGQSADESAKPPDGSAKQDEVGTGSGDANSEAPPPAAAQTSSGTDLRESMCLMIESAARANGLPLEFFARVIWQESRFRSDATGPRTRSGDNAQGIAQFMPRTAAERGLLDPFDPVQALPKSAEFLRELRDQFGLLSSTPLLKLKRV